MINVWILDWIFSHEKQDENHIYPMLHFMKEFVEYYKTYEQNQFLTFLYFLVLWIYGYLSGDEYHQALTFRKKIFKKKEEKKGKVFANIFSVWCACVLRISFLACSAFVVSVHKFLFLNSKAWWNSSPLKYP